MLNSLLSVFKSGSEFKGTIATLQHIESFVVNVLDAHAGDACSKNAAIDAVCQVLQSLKVSQSDQK